jgi:hypothetical protein
MDFIVEWILKDFLVQNTHKIFIQQSHSNSWDFFNLPRLFFRPTGLPSSGSFLQLIDFFVLLSKIFYCKKQLQEIICEPIAIQKIWLIIYIGLINHTTGYSITWFDRYMDCYENHMWKLLYIYGLIIQLRIHTIKIVSQIFYVYI